MAKAPSARVQASLEARFAAAMAQILPQRVSGLCLAVSGGSDSLALMRLTHRWATGRAISLHVVSIDHGLRRDSAQEAALVGRKAAALGLPHAVRRWTGWDGRGNLQDAARSARQTLLACHARESGAQAVLLGHTQDDQAETLLMRLARGSGVEGLGAMHPRIDHKGLSWLRPLLDVPRAELRAWLHASGEDWIEDPSNLDPRFDRVRIRQALAVLAPLGITAGGLASTAERLRAARDSLEHLAGLAAAELLSQDHGDYILQADGFDALPEDTRTRLVAGILCALSGTGYRPRLAPLQAALQARRATLHGCLLTRASGQIRISREYRAVAGMQTVPGQALWDGRWQLLPPTGQPLAQDAVIAALGPQGLAACPDRSLWRLPRTSLLSSPAVWQAGRLIAAPLAGAACGWQAVAHNVLCFGTKLSAPD